MYFAITGAIWMGGAGACIIGGLYTRWGTTAGAFAALIGGSTTAVSGMVLDQIWTSKYGTNLTVGGVTLTGQVILFIAIVVSWTLYVSVSLLGKRRHFNLDKMLHRGDYRIQSEHASEEEGASTHAPKKFQLRRLFGFTKDFTLGDKIIYSMTMAKSLILFFIFLGLTTAMLVVGLSEDTWAAYFKGLFWFMCMSSIAIAVWLAIGGVRDVINLYRDLATAKRDASDDGRVVDHEYEEETE